MKTEIKRLVGMTKSDFDKVVKGEGGIQLRRARLIPLSKPGDEMTLTSIFLSTLKLVEEFKKYLFKELKLQNGGKVYVYTEVAFKQFEKERVDGLILVVKAGKITDAALLEMKNKNSDLEKDQVERYIGVAKELKIPKVITVSNQFVSAITQNPLHINPPKSVELLHLSWSHILTIAHLLLFKNDMNIRDEDQVRIMEEVVSYLESSVSGVIGVTQMRKGWDELSKSIHSGSHIKISDPMISEGVLGWHQLERDLALTLSRRVGVFVKSGQKKFKTDLAGRLLSDSKKLVQTKVLDSSFVVRNAVSPIFVKGFFEKKSVEMSVSLTIPMDKTSKGKIGWLRKQIENCVKKNSKSNRPLMLDPIVSNELKVDVQVKRAKSAIRVPFDLLDSIVPEVVQKEVSSLDVVIVRDFRSGFTSRKKFVQLMENMLIEFYKGFVEHLVNWKQPTPKVAEDNYFNDIEYYIENSDLTLD